MRHVGKTVFLSTLLLACLATAWAAPAPLGRARAAGRLGGLVQDLEGTPQMGATVWIVGQTPTTSGPIKLFTNDKGVFSVDNLLPGLYSIRVSLASYLPAIRKNISVEAGQRAFLTVQLSTLFDSLQDAARQRPTDLEEDEWKWVLRTSAATRPVLRLLNGEIEVNPSGAPARAAQPRALLQVSSSAGQSDLGTDLGLLASLFAYDQALPDNSHLLLAGGFAYNRTPGGLLGMAWTPGPWRVHAPQLTLSMRQSSLPALDDESARLTYRGMKFGFSNSFQVSQRLRFDYGVDYVAVNLQGTTHALLPRGVVVYEPTGRARVEFTVASSSAPQLDSLAGAAQTLGAFPGITITNARPHLENVFHQEVRFGYHFKNGGELCAGAFRDQVHNAALFGRTRDREGLDPDEFLLDPASNGFRFNGGNYAVLGARVVYQQTFLARFETTLGYANLGGLAPVANLVEDSTALREILRAQRRHALSARVATRVPRLGTRVAAGYRWFSGALLGTVDPFEDSAARLDPNLSLQLRQPLPQIYLLPGRVEVLADIRNLLAQGYIPITSADGQVLYLVPAFRSFRGGVSFQF